MSSLSILSAGKVNSTCVCIILLNLCYISSIREVYDQYWKVIEMQYVAEARQKQYQCQLIQGKHFKHKQISELALHNLSGMQQQHACSYMLPPWHWRPIPLHECIGASIREIAWTYTPKLHDYCIAHSSDGYASSDWFGGSAGGTCIVVACCCSNHASCANNSSDLCTLHLRCFHFLLSSGTNIYSNCRCGTYICNMVPCAAICAGDSFPFSAAGYFQGILCYLGSH